MRILLVDDNEDDRFLAKLTLSKNASPDIEEAADLQVALKLLDDQCFDVLVTDWQLSRTTTAKDLVDRALEIGLKTVIRTGLSDRFGEFSALREIYPPEVEILKKVHPDTWENLRRSVER